MRSVLLVDKPDEDDAAVSSCRRGSATEIFFCINASALTAYKQDTLLDINFGRQQRFWDTFYIDPSGRCI